MQVLKKYLIDLCGDIDTAAKKEDVKPTFTADVRGLDGTELTTNEEAEQEQALEDTGFSMFNKGEGRG